MLAHNSKRTARLVSVVIFLTLLLFGHRAFADPLDTWTLRSTQGSPSQVNNLKNVTYANGLYLAVGDNGTVVTSKDQITWKSQTLVSASGVTDPKLYAVTYGNGLWVAVGSYIWTSPDAATWTYCSNPSPGPFYAVAYGNGIYVAAGGLGGLINSKPGPPVLATSPDGVTWTDRSTTSGVTAEPTKGLIFANGLFVQLAWHQPPYYSANGLTFTAASVPGDNNTSGIPGYNHAVGMAYGNGIFLVVGCCLDDNYGGSIMTSKDGMTWTKTTGPYFAELSENDSDFSLASNLAFGNGVFLGLEEDSANGNACGVAPTDTYTSTNGVTWTAHPLSNTGGNAVAASPAGFTLVGNEGAIYTTTSSGATWSLVSSPTIVWRAAAYGNGRFAAVGSGGNILSSQDGSTWSPVSNASLASTNFNSVVYGSAFIAAGTDQNSGSPSLASSADGINWTPQAVQSSAPTGALAFGKRTYIGAAGSTVYSSSDGVSWTTCASDPAGAGLNSATFGNGMFMVVGNQTIMTSPDAITWTSRASGLSYGLTGVAAGSGLFAAVGNNGAAISVSADGSSWSQNASGVSGGLNGIAFGSGRFVAIGGQGSITYSSDGKTWTPVSLPLIGSPWAIAYGNLTFIALTTNSILQSDSVPLPASSDPSASSGGGGGCFIATAAYGSDFAWQVRAFKEFRDGRLMTSPAGRAVVRLYYRVSPPIAALISGHPILKSATRLLLTPAAYGVRYPWQFAAAASVLCLFLLVVLARRRGEGGMGG